MKSIDLIGKVFGRYTVIEKFDQTKNKIWRWRCICQCGNERIVQGTNLTSGNSKSCGCLNREKLLKANTKHGLTKSIEYSIWTDIKTGSVSG